MDTQAKNIAAWTPVVAETLQGFVNFDDKAVRTMSLFLFRALTYFLAVHTLPPHHLSSRNGTSFKRHGT